MHRSHVRHTMCEWRNGCLKRCAASERGMAPTGVAPAARTKTGLAGSRCLKALIVAVNQAFGVRQWYTATKELQLTSLQLCEACRSAHTVHLRVDCDKPTSMLAVVDVPRLNSEERIFPRVPRLRPCRVTWQMPSVDFFSNHIDTFAQVEELYFGDAFHAGLDARPRQSRLPMINWFGSSRLDQPIVGVAWPALLRQLIFGRSFNQPIERVNWPCSLQHLTFGERLDQPIECAMWPSSLLRLMFGLNFNQPTNSIARLTSLRQLTFGYSFNQTVEGVTWPTSLRQLTFGRHFNQPIERVTLPTSLQHLTFGDAFNQLIDDATWPMSLRQLTFGWSFDQRIERVAWPRSLLQLTFGLDFNYLIDGFEWPSLERLTLMGRVRQSLRKLNTSMPAFQGIALYLQANSAVGELLREVKWPASLTHLTVFPGVCLEGVSIPSRVTVFYSVDVFR